MPRFRLIALSVIAVAAAIVVVAMRPPDAQSLRDAARSEYTSNSVTSENVYQQQVVAAWGTKDLVEVVSVQLDRQDDRPSVLLFLGILAVCVIGLTEPPAAATTTSRGSRRALEPEGLPPIEPQATPEAREQTTPQVSNTTREPDLATKPPDVASEWDGAMWVISPDPSAKWNGSQWLTPPQDAEAQWDGSQWQIRPTDGHYEWGHGKWLRQPSGPVSWDADSQSWKRPIWLRPWFLAAAAVVVGLVVWLGVGFLQARNQVPASEAAAQVQELIRSKVESAETDTPSSQVVNGVVQSWNEDHPNSAIKVYSSGRIVKIQDPANDAAFCIELPANTPPGYEPTVRDCQ